MQNLCRHSKHLHTEDNLFLARHSKQSDRQRFHLVHLGKESTEPARLREGLRRWLSTTAESQGPSSHEREFLPYEKHQTDRSFHEHFYARSSNLHIEPACTSRRSPPCEHLVFRALLLVE